MKMADKDIYKMKLHEVMVISGNVEAMRVPGGWLYTYFNSEVGGTDMSVFVQFNNEFMECVTSLLNDADLCGRIAHGDPDNV